MAEPAETVRSLTGLSADELPDETIAGLLAAHGDDPKLAAAAALEQRAVRLSSVIASDDMRIDDTKAAAMLREQATRLREQAADDAGDGFFFGTTLGERCGAELTERGWTW